VPPRLVFIYALAWLRFGVVHSGLKGAQLKDLFTGNPRAAGRLTYNVVVAAQVSAVWLMGGYVFTGAQNYAPEPLGGDGPVRAPCRRLGAYGLRFAPKIWAV